MTKKKIAEEPEEPELQEYDDIFGPQEGKFIELIRLEPQTDQAGRTISGFIANFHPPMAPTLELIKKRYGPGSYRVNLKKQQNKHIVKTSILNIAPDKPTFELDEEEEFEDLDDLSTGRFKKLELTIEDLKRELIKSKDDFDIDKLMRKFMVYRMMAKVFDNSNDTIKLLGQAYSGNLEALIQGMELGGLKTEGGGENVWEKVASGIISAISGVIPAEKLKEKAQEMLKPVQITNQPSQEITMGMIDELGSMKKILDMILGKIDEGTITATQIVDSLMMVSPSACERLKNANEETLINTLGMLFPEDKELLADPKTKDILHQVITILKAKG